MKKLVLKVGVHDEESKRAALKAVSRIQGVDSLSINMEKQTLTVTGDVDAIEVVTKLRKLMHADIETAGPNKEPEKKKEDGKDGKSKELEEILKPPYYNAYYNYYRQPDYYYCVPVQENQDVCVIS